MSKTLTFKDFKVGKKFDFGTTTLSEEEIIRFAKAFDPLEFHIDKEAAEKSIFKGLVASGPHIFTKVHREKWIPLFKNTVLAGLEVNNWKFLKPVYANSPIHSSATIIFIKENKEENHAVVTWLYEFKNNDGELVQTLEMTILQKTD